MSDIAMNLGADQGIVNLCGFFLVLFGPFLVFGFLAASRRK
jgi:hypothetical protein